MSDTIFSIPVELENLQDASLALPDPSLLQYYKDLEERVLWIEGEISENLMEFEKLILKWNREDRGLDPSERRPIKMYINSPGGLLHETLSFIGMMQLSATPIHTINAGVAYSAASLILIAGHKRYAMPNSKCLIHSGSGGFGGTYEQTQEQAKEYKSCIDNMKSFILEHTTIPTRTYNKNAPKDWYINTDDCLSLGIVDEIVESLDDIL